MVRGDGRGHGRVKSVGGEEGVAVEDGADGDDGGGDGGGIEVLVKRGGSGGFEEGGGLIRV